MGAASSSHRTVRATSAGSPIRLSGWRSAAARRRSSFDNNRAASGVSVSVGATALTRIPRGQLRRQGPGQPFHRPVRARNRRVKGHAQAHRHRAEQDDTGPLPPLQRRERSLHGAHGPDQADLQILPQLGSADAGERLKTDAPVQ